MVLRLYHVAKKSVTVFNVIKFSVDDDWQVSVQIKEGSDIKRRFYDCKKDFQRLTVQVD